MTTRENRQLYIDYIKEHQLNVKTSWKILEKNASELFKAYDSMIIYTIDELINIHDESKYSIDEFEPYRQHFFPTSGELKNEKLFNKAWEHHKQNNPHHWQTWTAGNYTEYYKFAYFIEMLCDWIAMGMKFNNTAKDYYKKNKDEIKLPKQYIQIMYTVFDKIYVE